MAVLPVGISGEEAGFQIERSLRCNSADSAYLSRTPASAGNRKTWTWSGWVKRGNLGTFQGIFGAGGSSPNYDALRFTDTNTLQFYTGGAVSVVVATTAVFRDPSAWYHISIAFDTTQATSANRVRLYVNGVEQTLSGTFPNQNTDWNINTTVPHAIGAQAVNGAYSLFANGYLTEINFIDGQALTPSSFGETDTVTGVWKPKKYTGTYGTNGFYLNFSDNSGVTSTTLGKDYSGNGNNWTPNNFSVTAGAGNDSLVDTPTPYGTDTGVGGEVRGNYATLNPLDNGGATLRNGNLDITNTSASHLYARHTFQLPTSGKWYWEVTGTWDANSRNGVGVIASTTATNNYPWGTAQSFGWYLGSNTSNWYWSNNGSLGFNIVPSSPAVFQICYDADNGTIYAGINNTFYSSAGASTGNPSTLTNPTSSSVPLGLFPATGVYQSGSMVVNHGQRPFAYTAPSGFKALCTQNLPEPTIVDGGDYFNAVLFTGTSGNVTVSGVGFQPDWVWIKARSNVQGHELLDAVRGGNKLLLSNSTSAESTLTSPLTFNSDGFVSTTDTHTNGYTYVAWNWKANGAGVSNTAGTITSTVSANTDSGFSIVTYDSNPTGTVGHGLNAVPKIIIEKKRDTTSDWFFNHSLVDGSWDFLRLNTTDANSNAVVSAPTSTVFSPNSSGDSMVAYCFAAIPSFSAMGSYQGNGSSEGPFVYTGFRPRFVMVKRTNDISNWLMFDTARNEYNLSNKSLFANLSNAENTGGNEEMDILSNGWKPRNASASFNISGSTYIYMAFAENPFKYSLAR